MQNQPANDNPPTLDCPEYVILIEGLSGRKRYLLKLLLDMIDLVTGINQRS